MKRTLSALFLLLFALMLSDVYAQPGHGPMGPPPGGGRYPGQSPRNANNQFNRPDNDMRANTVTKKKKVREGTKFKVVGALRDSISGEVLPYVNLSILDSVDSTFVKGGSTNLDGYFEIDGITSGGYFLRVSAIGYQVLMLPLHVSNNTAMGTLKLKPGATQLKEVVVTSSRPLYAMDGEKMVYNVSDDPSIQSGTTSDALQNAPGVEVDIEGNITLRGVSSVEIWINDKPSKLTAENLKTYLETLPANALDRIETITNPSAKYATDAESVINIITSAYIKSNQFISFGLHGASQPSVSPWLSYMWANERLSINLFAAGRYNHSENNSSRKATSRTDNPAGGYDDVTTVRDENESKNNTYGANMGLHIDYTIDSMTDLGFHSMFNYNYAHSKSMGTELYSQKLPTVIEYNYFDTNSNHNHSRFGRYGADLTHKFDREGHNLRLSFDGNFNSGSVFNNIDRDYENTLTFDDEHKYYRNSTRKQSYSIDARYNRPYSRQGEMSYGLGMSHSKTHNTYSRLLMDNTTHQYSIIDTLRAYEFKGNDSRINGDVNWTHRWGNFTLELGLGGRYDQIVFNYISQQDGFSDDTTYNFFTISPSIHTSYRTESMHNFKLNYTLRMSNPGEAQLTTFKKYSEESYSVGNRALKSSRTHSMEAGWTKFFESFGSVGIEAYGRYSDNEISSLTEATDAEDIYLNHIINYSTPYNMGSSYRIGGTLHMTYRPSGFINVRLYGNIYDYGYRMQHNDLLLENNKLSYSIRLNVWAKLFDRYQFYVMGNYNSPTISLASESKARYGINFGVRTDFFKRRLSAFIHVQDIFNWGKRIGSGSRNTNPYYLVNSTSKTINSRFISAGITLRFGKMELEKRAQGAEGGNGEVSE